MKKWLTDRFLPMWAKETVMRENRQLWLENDALRQKLSEMECYIRGLHRGLRGRRGEQ